MIVWLSGPTGSGKSSFGELLALHGYKVIREHIPPDRFMGFHSEPSKYCAALQEEIMRSRFDQWKRNNGAGDIVLDRSVEEDGQVFCRLHHERGRLNNQEFDHLSRLSQQFTRQMAKPDLILFMSPSMSVLQARMDETGHPSAIMESLPRQVSLYEQWIQKRSEPTIRIDNSGCSLEVFERFMGKRR